MRLPDFVAFGTKDASALGINPFALTLIAESFADDPNKFKDSNVLVSANAHNGTAVFMVITKTMPHTFDFDVHNDLAITLLNACRVVKSFLNKLEDGTSPEDPLREIRRHFHAPLHAVLDDAISKAAPAALTASTEPSPSVVDQQKEDL